MRMRIRRLMFMILCFGLFGGLQAQSYPVDDVTLRIPSMTTMPGDQIQVPVVLEDLNVSGLIAFNIDVAYDPDALTLVSGSPGTLLQDWQFAYNVQTPGVIAVGAYNSEDLPASGVLFYMTFEVAMNTTHGQQVPLTFTRTVLNAGGYTITTAPGTITIETAHVGDADNDGQVTPADAQAVLQAAVGLPTTIDDERADADGNGEVQAYDAGLILQYVVGIITTFPNR